MGTGRIGAAVLAAIVAVGVAACGSAAPLQYGQYPELAPRVAATKGERVPQHVTIQLAHAANVAVFLVRPGGTTSLLFPADSTESGHVDAGSHVVSTMYAGMTLNDTSHLIRRPSQRSGGIRPTQRSGMGRDSIPSFGFSQHGYLLLYASQQPLPYSILATRVAGLSVPVEDEDALNTVTKLIRERTQTTGTWAAYATAFPP